MTYYKIHEGELYQTETPTDQSTWQKVLLFPSFLSGADLEQERKMALMGVKSGTVNNKINLKNMREIKFRGLRVDGKGWVYGDLNQHPIHYDCQIIENGVILHSVITETVGQFTGVSNSDGVEVYEGDLIKYDHQVAVVRCNQWEGGYFKTTVFVFGTSPSICPIDCGAIIGNIHENKELLKAEPPNNPTLHP